MKSLCSDIVVLTYNEVYHQAVLNKASNKLEVSQLKDPVINNK